MDYKKKLKQRLYIGVIYIALGVMMIVGVFSSKSDNDLISAFGFSVTMVGVARIIQYLKITKNEDSIKKQKINETDERNLLIIQKANSAAFYISTILLGIIAIVLSFFDKNDISQWICYCIFLFVFINLICYFVYQKKL